jgi:WD40 repeat protein
MSFFNIDYTEELNEATLAFERILTDFTSIPWDHHHNDSFEKFTEIQRQLDLHREELKLDVCDRIDKIFFRMTKKLKAKRDAITKIQKESYSKIVASDLNKMTETTMQQFADPNVTNETVRQLAIDEIQSKIDAFRSQIDDVNSFAFTKGKVALNEDTFGCLKLYRLQLRAITCSADENIKVWDLETGECVQTLVHDGEVCNLEKLDQNRIVSCGGSFIKVWDVQQGTCLQTLTGHNDSVIVCIKVLPNNFLASSSREEITIWSLQDGSCLKNLNGHTDDVNCLIVLTDGRLVSCSEDMTIKVWDLEDGTCTQTLMDSTNFSRVLLLSNGFLASCSDGEDGTIKIWNLETGHCLKTMVGHDDVVYNLEQIRESEIMSCSRDGTIKAWSLQTGECVACFGGHGRALFEIKKYQSDKLVTASDDGAVKVWDTVTKKCIKTINTDHEDAILDLILF